MKTEQKTAHLYETICIVTALAIFIYSCIRATLISISYDEAVTYLIYVQGDLKDIFQHTLANPSNNHLLNTLLIKLFVPLFGNSEIVLRLPSLIGHGVYLTGTFLLLRLFLRRMTLLLCYVMMITSPFLLDFFSCSRGYGLALGFMALSMYFIFKKISNQSSHPIRDSIAAISLLTLTLFSNLGFLNFYLPTIVLLILFEMYTHRDVFQQSMLLYLSKISAIIVPIIVSIAILQLVYTPPVIHRILTMVSLWGGTRNLWDDTFQSLIQCVFYEQPYATPDIITLSSFIIGASYFIAFALVLTGIFRKHLHHPKFLFLAWTTFLIFLIGIILFAEHVLLHKRYPIDRGVIYLVFLYMLLVALLTKIAHDLETGRLRDALILCLSLFISLVILHHVACLNTTHFYLWSYDANTKEVMSIIRDESIHQRTSSKITIGITWRFKPSTNYYIEKNHLGWIERTKKKATNADHNYYYIEKKLLHNEKNVVKKSPLRLIKYFPLSKSYLAAPVLPTN